VGSTEEPEEARVIAEQVLALEDPSLEGWRAPAVIHILAHRGGEPELHRLAELLQQHPGDSRVLLHLRDGDGDHELDLGSEYAAAPVPGLRAAVAELFGEGSYREEAIRAPAPLPRFRGRSR
jgi:hypothetical protein